MTVPFHAAWTAGAIRFQLNKMPASLRCSLCLSEIDYEERQS